MLHLIFKISDLQLDSYMTLTFLKLSFLIYLHISHTVSEFNHIMHINHVSEIFGVQIMKGHFLFLLPFLIPNETSKLDFVYCVSKFFFINIGTRTSNDLELVFKNSTLFCTLNTCLKN